MKYRLHPIFAPYMRPVDDDTSTGGGAADRGDDWTPTDDDDDAKDLKAKLEADEAAKKGTKEEEATEGEGKKTEGARSTDGEGEGEGDDDEEGKGKDKKRKDGRIPLSRHEEILRKQREQVERLERELAATKAGQQVVKRTEDLAKAEDEVAKMEGEYLKLLEKGEVKEAAAKMAEIRRAERAIVEQRQAVEIQTAEARAYERVRYDNTVERLEAAYPVMNPDHKDFDEEKTAEIVELRDAYLATRKYTRADALQKAVKTLLGTETKKQEAATEVDVRVDKDDVAKQVAADRKKAQVGKNLDAAAKQPPNTAAVGQDHDAAGGKLKGSEVIKLDQKAFAKLSEKELSALRGDEI